MTQLTRKQEIELEALWNGGKLVEWLDKLREYAPDQETTIPKHMIEAIEKSQVVRSQEPNLYVPDDCTPERLAHYARAPDDEVIIEVFRHEGPGRERRTEKATAGMLRRLLAAVRTNSEAMAVVSKNLKLTLREIETGTMQNPDEPTWVSVRQMFDEIMLELFGPNTVPPVAAIKLRNIALFVLRREAEGQLTEI